MSLSNENFGVTQGSALVLTAQLRHPDGSTASGYAGTEDLATVLWPGGNRASSGSPATSWADHAAGIVTIVIDETETAALPPGRYQLLTRVTVGGRPTDGYGCTLDIFASAGMGAAPRAYGDYNGLLMFGRSWLRQLQTDDDEAGFAEQLGRARSWLEDLAHAHYRVASMCMVVGEVGMGPRRSGARSTWLQEQLDADTLMLTDQVKEAAAKKTLAFICEGQVGLGEQAGQYARLARMYHAQADYLGTCLVLSLDTDGDGFADVTIDCSSTDPLYG